MKNKKFPDGFLWGGSTSAYQFEGGWNLGGKGMSIQDVRTNIPKGTTDFKVASDHFNNWKEDVSLMAEMGFKSYRFSISWARVIPSGTGAVNPLGIKFYNDLINELLNKKITPIITMFHFDLPAELDKNGGWLNKEIVNAFENYAKVLFENFGDRVKHWLTINEQNVMMLFGEVVGIDFGKSDNKLKSKYQVNHHMMLAQAKANILCHKLVKNGKIGPAPNINPAYPATTKPIDNTATFNLRIMRNFFFLDVAVFGRYHYLVLNYLKKENSMFEIQNGDMEILNDKLAKPDFIAFNYYSSSTVVMPEKSFKDQKLSDQQVIRSLEGMYQQVPNDNLLKTEFGWEIDPIGFRNVLRELYDRYNLPLIITENGIGGHDKLNDGKVDDQYRIEYYKYHLKEMKIAMDDGVEVIGYNPWSAIDLISTHEGCTKRYGFVFVNRDEFDLRDMSRHRKQSFYWYKDVIKTNGENL